MKLRKHLFSVVVLLISTIAGILSRRMSSYLPAFIALYTGDTLWALAFFALFRIVFSRLQTWETALLTLNFCFLIELSQLLQPAWLNAIRQTIPGGLLLGFGFRWTDLLCYTAGSGLGYLLFSCHSIFLASTPGNTDEILR